MTIDKRTTRDVGSIDADVIGKVFVVRSHGLRECLICGEVFTGRPASRHTEVSCYPRFELLPLKQSQGGKHVT